MRRLFFAALLLFAMPAAAQDAPQLSDRMAPFAGLVGEWRGSGWMIGPGGQRAEFQSHEVVTPRLSGNALLVEGQHRAGDRLVHDAMAMIVWDAAANGWRFRSALATGMGGDFPIAPQDGALVWSMDTPGGRIEYRIELTVTTWHETGRRALPDGRWIDFFEMTLTRQ